MKLKSVELHTPIMLGGKNFGTKIYTVSPTGASLGIEMRYDRKERELLLVFNGQTAIVPVGNVASMVEDDGKYTYKKPIVPSGGVIKAQVSVPAGLKNE